MNLFDEMTRAAPVPSIRGTVVLGPCGAGNETKPTGRPPDLSRRARVLEALEDGPASTRELAAALGMKTDQVRHVLVKLQKERVVALTYVTTVSRTAAGTVKFAKPTWSLVVGGCYQMVAR